MMVASIARRGGPSVVNPPSKDESRIFSRSECLESRFDIVVNDMMQLD